jgi:hypothetical protein
MSKVDRDSEAELLHEGMGRLRELIGPHLETGLHYVGVPEPANLTGPRDEQKAELLVTVEDPQGGALSVPILVEAKHSITPAQLASQLRPQVELMRRLMGDAAVLIISPWLSPRTRQMLDELGYGYLDLTGNVSFRLNRPAIHLRLDGAQRDPEPAGLRGPSRLRGGKAGRIVRLLIDVSPPYQGIDLARATALSLPYVSRLLDAMREQALVTRRGRVITDVDWAGLLRVRAEARNLLKATTAAAFVAPAGQSSVLAKLRDLTVPAAGPTGTSIAVTGSTAAAAVAPITVGGQLMLYVHNASQTRESRLEDARRELGLLRGEDGGDVLLLSPDDPVIFTGTRVVDGIPHVALSQLVLDSLAGPGRMPAEGEELLTFMQRDVDRWRLTSIADWRFTPTTQRLPG